jgi:hypothetical protein
VVDAGGGAEGEGAGPGGDEALRVGVRDPGVAPIRPRPVVVELAHPPPLSSDRTFSFPCVGGEAPGRNRWMGFCLQGTRPSGAEGRTDRRNWGGARIYGMGLVNSCSLRFVRGRNGTCRGVWARLEKERRGPLDPALFHHSRPAQATRHSASPKFRHRPPPAAGPSRLS